MNQTEKDFSSTMLRIGAAMLLFLALLNGIGVILFLFKSITGSFLSEKSATVLNDIIYQFGYLFSFIFPAGFFYMISKNKRTEKVFAEVRLGIDFPLMLLGGIAAILSAAYVNSSIMEVFHYSEFMNGFFGEDLSENYLLILSFITTALVPAFCEEFLFRGVVLSNMLPYGKTTAVIGSAVLFALMHQNAGQLFYTFIAGIVLGLIYVRTRSIWGCVLVHFFNNLLSVIEQLMLSRLEHELAYKICTYIEGAIFALGLISAVILVIIERKKKRDYSGSSFGVILEKDENFVERPLERGRAAKLFFSPTVIVFTSISGVEMVFLIILALIKQL